jgi:hypothetical protein
MLTPDTVSPHADVHPLGTATSIVGSTSVRLPAFRLHMEPIRDGQPLVLTTVIRLRQSDYLR